MFGKDHSDLTRTVGAMQSEAFQRCKANRYETRDLMVEMIRNDRRLDGYDAERVATRVQECGQYGKRLDWDDPFLKKGGQSRDGWRTPPGSGFR